MTVLPFDHYQGHAHVLFIHDLRHFTNRGPIRLCGVHARVEWQEYPPVLQLQQVEIIGLIIIINNK